MYNVKRLAVGKSYVYTLCITLCIISMYTNRLREAASLTLSELLNLRLPIDILQGLYYDAYYNKYYFYDY